MSASNPVGASFGLAIEAAQIRMWKSFGVEFTQLQHILY